MPFYEREPNREGERARQQSISDSGRINVPMWDSSDPERNPPPLPLHPQTPGSSPTRAGTSANVAAAAQALVGRAREAMTSNAYSRETSPDKLGRSPQHRRLQSLQGFDANTSPERHGSRTSTPMSSRDTLSGSSDVDSPPNIAGTKDLLRDPPALRPTARQPPRPLFGENTPPSATVRPLQNMVARDYEPPLGDVTNSSYSFANLDKLHSQILNLTTIATTLQKDMTALSRRSKDNATDLISLKEATHTRDEDIRKSLKELVHNVRSSDASFVSTARGDSGRPNSSMGFSSSSHEGKTFSSQGFSRSVFLPKIPSIHAFEDNDRLGTCVHVVDSAANLAMLEKIIREMGTKEGQERVLQTLTQLSDRSASDLAITSKGIEELVNVIKPGSTSQALVKHNDDESHSHIEFIMEQIAPLVERLKDGIHQNGGMTSEVKSLVRELRGEVLGMGRELGLKLDEASQPKQPSQSQITTVEVQNIVAKGLEDLRHHMEDIIVTRQLQMAAANTKTSNSSEVYDMVKYALDERGLELSQSLERSNAGLTRESILSTMKEAYDIYKPEIELQQFGLERDEILQCLREGLDDYRVSNPEQHDTGMSRNDIMEAIGSAMQHFAPPTLKSDNTILKNDIVQAVQSYLEAHELSRDDVERQNLELTRQDVIGVLGHGMETLKHDNAQHLNTSRDVLMDAVKAGFEKATPPGPGNNDQVLESLRQIISKMWEEVKQYSAATSQSNEEVLVTMREGLETLRQRMEVCVDGSQGVRDKNDILHTVVERLDEVRKSIPDVLSGNRKLDQSATSEMVDFIRSEFEHLHQAIHARSSPGYDSIAHKEEILLALSAGFAGIEAETKGRGNEHSSRDVLDSMKTEIGHLRQAVVTGTATYQTETLETVQQSTAEILSCIVQNATQQGQDSEMAASVAAELIEIRDILQTSVQQSQPTTNTAQALSAVSEALDALRTQLANDQTEATREFVSRIESSLDVFRDSISQTIADGGASNKAAEILEAIRAGQRLDDSRAIQADGQVEESSALEALRNELEFLRQSISKFLVQNGAHGSNNEVLDALRVGFDEAKARYHISDTATSGLDEMLTIVNQSLDDFRIDVAKIADKATDLTGSSTILEALEKSLSEIKLDIAAMKSESGLIADGDIVLAADGAAQDISGNRAPAGRNSRHKSESVEASITQLQLKIDTLSQDLHTHSIGAMPADIKEAIRTLSELQQSSAVSNTADIAEAVANKLEGQIFPVMESIATKDNLDTIEAVSRLTNEAIDGLVLGFNEKAATRADIAPLESLLQQIALRLSSSFHEADTMDSAAAIRDICTDIKATVTDMHFHEDVQRLNERLVTFEQSQKSMEKRYEDDIGTTAKAFDDRKTEALEILEQIEDVKIIIGASKDEIKSRMKRSNDDVRALDEILQGIEDKVDASNGVAVIQDLKQIVAREVETTHKGLEDVRKGQEAHAAGLAAASEMLRSAMTDELSRRLDTFASQQSNSHTAAQRAADALTERASQQDDLLAESRSISEELKITVDTLGVSVTALTPALTEATNKISDDAKTVFNRIEELQVKMDDVAMDDKSNHDLTRDEVRTTLTAINILHEQASNFHPKFFDLLTALTTTVEQHFEHAKRFEDPTNDVARSESVTLLPKSLEMTGESIHTKLDSLLERVGADTVDLSNVHSKLDALLSAPTSTSMTADRQIGRLDEVHQQLIATAADVSALLSFQSKLADATANNRASDVYESSDTTYIQNKKEKIEAVIASLTNTKCELENQINNLKSDRDALRASKLRLTAEISSLETAMTIRKEDMQVMDARADALERRIIEGIIDHSRALLITKKSPLDMSLKRVSSNVSQSHFKAPEEAMHASFGLAARSRPPSRPNAGPVNPMGRRILSLSQIGGNARSPQGMTVSPQNKDTGLEVFKRAHTVRGGGMRKSSWGGRPSAAAFEKENDIRESEDQSEDDDSDTRSTEHHSSHLGGYRSVGQPNVGSRVSYGTGFSLTTQGTGSYFTGSESNRSTSIGSTMRSIVGVNESIYEDSTDVNEEETDDDASTVGDQEMVDSGDEHSLEPTAITEVLIVGKAVENHDLAIVRRNGYDSGLGSDCPTADLQAMIEGEYFGGSLETT